jgi:hypothetical protein
MKKTLLYFIILLPYSKAVSQNWLDVGGGVYHSIFNPQYVHNIEADTTNSKIYVCGVFDMAGNNTGYRNIACWNGLSWDSLGNGMSFCGDLKMYNGDLIVYGKKNNTSNYEILKWSNPGWNQLGTTGKVVGTGVYEFLVFNNELYAAGKFDTIDGVPAKNIAKWNGVSWSALTGGGTNNKIENLCIYNGEIYACGSFTVAGSTPASYIAKYNGTNWDSVGAGTNSQVLDICVYNNKLYATGNFNIAGTAVANNIASWNGALWSPVGSGLNSMGTGLCVFNNKLYVMGQFSSPSSLIAEWDDNTWMPLVGGGVSMSPSADAMVVLNNELFVAGNGFYFAGTTPVKGVAKYSLPVNIQEVFSIKVMLNQNAPNPFNNETTINYYLPEFNSYAQMVFYDNTGKIINTIDIAEKGKGQINIKAENSSAGVYTYTIIVDGEIIDRKKLVLVK